MIAVLFITGLLFLLALVFAYSRRKHKALDVNYAQARPLERAYQGLFPAPPVTDADVRAAEAEAARRVEELRAALLARAVAGDCTALAGAKSNRALYGEVLDALVTRALSAPPGDQKTIRADGEADPLGELAAYITRGDGLPASVRLARAVLARWRQTLDRRTLAETLHVVALTDDAGCYHAASKAALGVWRAGEMPTLSAAELNAAIESHYWLLSADARSSGAGFALKEFLAAARRDLLASARRASA
jgi:hypothetical protein